MISILLMAVGFIIAVLISGVAAAEFLVGAAYLNGIQGAITITPAGGSDMGATMNMSNRSLSDDFKKEEIPSQNGAVIESIVASQRRRKVTMKFAPKGATRALCQTFISTVLFTMEPLVVLTVAASTIAIYNGSYNYMGGAQIEETRDGYCVANIECEQYETAATAGTFAALAKITG